MSSSSTYSANVIFYSDTNVGCDGVIVQWYNCRLWWSYSRGGDAGVVFVVISVVGGEEEEDEGEEEEADLPDVLQAEDVPAKGDGHLEELPESEGHQANKCDPFDDGGGRSRARRIVGRAWNKNLSIKNNPFELHVMLNKSKSK